MRNKPTETTYDYRVVVSRSLGQFEDAVKERLNNGWKCQGGCTTDDDGYFTQAMVRETKRYIRREF